MVQKVLIYTKTVRLLWISNPLRFIMWKSIVEFLFEVSNLVECADRLQNNNYSWFSTWFSKKDHFIIHVFKHEFPTYKNLYRLVKCINRLYIQLLIAKCCRIISTVVPISADVTIGSQLATSNSFAYGLMTLLRFVSLRSATCSLKGCLGI